MKPMPSAKVKTNTQTSDIVMLVENQMPSAHTIQQQNMMKRLSTLPPCAPRFISRSAMKPPTTAPVTPAMVVVQPT